MLFEMPIWTSIDCVEHILRCQDPCVAQQANTHHVADQVFVGDRKLCTGTPWRHKCRCSETTCSRSVETTFATYRIWDLGLRATQQIWRQTTLQSRYPSLSKLLACRHLYRGIWNNKQRGTTRQRYWKTSSLASFPSLHPHSSMTGHLGITSPFWLDESRW